MPEDSTFVSGVDGPSTLSSFSGSSFSALSTSSGDQREEDSGLMSMMLTGFCIVIVLLLISVILVFVTGEATEHSTEDNSYGVSSGGSGGGSSVTPRSLPRPLPPVTSRPSPGGVPRSSPSGRRPSGSSHSTGGPTARPPASSTSVSGGLTVTTPPVIPLSPVTQVPVVPTTRSTAAVPSTQSRKTVALSTQLTRTVRPTIRSTTTMPTTTRSTTTMRTTTRSTTTMRTTTRSTTTMRTTTRSTTTMRTTTRSTTTMRTTTRSTTTMRTTTRSTTPSTTVATPRSGIMFCVVGATFRDTNLFTKNFCDYAVFPDLIARNGTFKPIYGLTNWNTFKESTSLAKNVEVGLGFTPSGMGKPGSTIDLIPSMGSELSRLVRALNASALGVFNFEYRFNVPLRTLQAAFQAFATAVSVARTARNKEPMTFLGVWMASSDDRTKFVAEVLNMRNVTTLILQTHIARAVTRHQDCVSVPVSLMTSRGEYPTYEIAVAAATNLRAKGDRFRIMFSSTLGVMVFVGLKSSGTPKGPNQACEQAFMMGIDLTCNMAHPAVSMQGYDQRQQYSYLSYESGNNIHYASYESEKSLAEKMNMFVVNMSDGWALFEVDRDTWRPCGRPFMYDYPRLTRAQQQARHREVVDTRFLPTI